MNKILILVLFLQSHIFAGVILEKDKKTSYLGPVEDLGDEISIKVEIGKFTRVKKDLAWYSLNNKITNYYYAGRVCEKENKLSFASLFYKKEIKAQSKFSNKAQNRLLSLKEKMAKISERRSRDLAHKNAVKEAERRENSEEAQRLKAQEEAERQEREDAKNSAGKWLTDYDKAIKLAKSTKKPLIINFTGSDWCGWCIKLKREVFEKQEFISWAKKNAVLFECDRPRGTKLPAKIDKQNSELVKKYQIRGFPTILIFDYKNRELGKTGYLQGGPSNWTKNAERIIGK